MMEANVLLNCVKYISMGLAIGLGVLGPALALGIATKAIVDSIARQPESEKQIRVYYFIGAGLIEACAIYALFVIIMIAFMIK